MSWEDWEAYFEYEASGYAYEDEENTNKAVATHLYLIDGDNNINEAIERIGIADKTDDVRIFVSQEGLFNRLNNKRYPYVKVIKVTPGAQAVDNQIKSVFGNAVKSEMYDEIYIISKDKGYDDLIQKYRSRYGIRKNKIDRRERF